MPVNNDDVDHAALASRDCPPGYPRLLLVDDDPDHVELQAELLREHFPNATLRTAATAAEALAHDVSRIDVALCDLHLPDCSGLELLNRLRDGHDLPVVLITGEREATAAAEAIRSGAVDFVVKHGDYLRVVPIVVEKALALTEMKAANRRLENELVLRNAELERLNEQLRDMACRDSLTGLYNRRYFTELLAQLFSESQRYQTDLTCMMIDLDNFKRVNDTLGHQTGDRLLQLTASVIRGAIRESDAAVRYGGDEFAVLLPRTTPDEARASAKRIVSQFRQEVFDRMPDAAVATLSIGLASREHDQPQTSEALISLADEALYLAKTGGKDRIMVVRPVVV